MGFQYIKDPHFDVFESFLLIHLLEIQTKVIADPLVDEQDKATIKADIIAMVANVVKNCSDEQIKIIT